jgi:hypothetical protein
MIGLLFHPTNASCEMTEIDAISKSADGLIFLSQGDHFKIVENGTELATTQCQKLSNTCSHLTRADVAVWIGFDLIYKQCELSEEKLETIIFEALYNEIYLFLFSVRYLLQDI